MADKMYIDVHEVMETLGIGSSKAYAIIKQLNKELKEKGYITVSGKCNRRYFMEKTYGIGQEVKG